MTLSRRRGIPMPCPKRQWDAVSTLSPSTVTCSISINFKTSKSSRRASSWRCWRVKTSEVFTCPQGTPDYLSDRLADLARWIVKTSEVCRICRPFLSVCPLQSPLKAPRQTDCKTLRGLVRYLISWIAIAIQGYALTQRNLVRWNQP